MGPRPRKLVTGPAVPWLLPSELAWGSSSMKSFSSVWPRASSSLALIDVIGRAVSSLTLRRMMEPVTSIRCVASAGWARASWGNPARASTARVIAVWRAPGAQGGQAWREARTGRMGLSPAKGAVVGWRWMALGLA